MNQSNNAINKIGDIIRRGKNDGEYTEAIEALNIWREAHGEILDSFYDRSVKLANSINKNNIIVAQRLKRLLTIVGKLDRFKQMRLSSMQDIAGVRIIVGDMNQLKIAEEQIEGWANLIKIRDYIENPKPSGYRGKHFIFKEGGMYVEVQLRTILQHLWATSVETTDVFRGASLKEKDDKTCWHDFFCQVSSIFALSENTNLVPEYKNMKMAEICKQLEENMQSNYIGQQITSFALTAPIVTDKKIDDAYYAVISLDFEKKKAIISRYKESEYHLAFQEYEKLERNSNSKRQTVLIAVNQIKKIKDAYPNYFMNLSAFLDIIKFILAENQRNK